MIWMEMTWKGDGNKPVPPSEMKEGGYIRSLSMSQFQGCLSLESATGDAVEDVDNIFKAE